MANEAGNVRMMLAAAKEEIEHIQKYVELLSEYRAEEAIEERLFSMIADSFNHALVAIYTASASMGVPVPERGIPEAMDDADFDCGDYEEESTED